MLPHYQLPPRHRTAGTINPDFSPDQVGSWLAKLPLAGADEAAEKLGRFLSAFSRIDLPSQHRSQLAGLLKTGAWHLAARLAQDIAEHPLPLAATPYRWLSLSQSLLGELANSQKLLILASLHQNDLALAASRLADLLETLGRQLLNAYRSHTPTPTGAWRDLHQSYWHAAHRGIAESSAHQGRNSMTEHYKSLLLLAMADPYQFTARELEWAHALALSIAPATGLTVAGSGKLALAPFHIDSQSDEAPQALARSQTEVTSGLLFDTSAATRQLALLGNAIKHRRATAGMRLPPESEWPAYLTLLNKLKLRWGASKHRLVKRHKPHLESHYAVSLGLDSLRQLTSPPDTHSRRSAAVFDCVTLNNSAGGLALRCANQLPHHIGVGEIVGLRQQQAAVWRAGLVRWFKQSREDELLFGLQLLAGRAEPVQVLGQDADAALPGLLLQDTSSARPTHLLLAKGHGQADQSLRLQLAGGERTIVLRQLMETGNGSEVFRVEPA